MDKYVLDAQRAHLVGLLDAIQRCVYSLDASGQKLTWPLSAEFLEKHKKNVEIFESLAAINERFAKLQDTLGAAMRHANLLAGEPSETFLKVLGFYEKAGVLESVASWQLCRTTRSLATHDYETEYAEIADHFNSLQILIPSLYGDAFRFVEYCHSVLGIVPHQGDFSDDFIAIVKTRPGVGATR